MPPAEGHNSIPGLSARILNTPIHQPIPKTNKAKANKSKRKPSIRAKRALVNLVANGGNKAKAIRDAGFADITAKTPEKVFGSVALKPEVDKVVAKLESLRERALQRMAKMSGKASYRDAVYGVDILTKNHQLLTGGKTENNGLQELAEQFNQLIETLK